MPRAFVAITAALGLSLALAACYRTQKTETNQITTTDWCSTTPVPSTARVHPAANEKVIGPLEQQVVQFSSSKDFSYVPKRTWCGVRNDYDWPNGSALCSGLSHDKKSYSCGPYENVGRFLSKYRENEVIFVFQNKDVDFVRVFTVWYE